VFAPVELGGPGAQIGKVVCPGWLVDAGIIEQLE